MSWEKGETMGVYHLMGLGRSPGAITGPVSYLAHRYVRYNPDDQVFFSGSGEKIQRQAGQRVGNIQAVVFFTTQEVYDGDVKAFRYIVNPPGSVPKNPAEQEGKAMRELLPGLLSKEWELMAKQHARDNAKAGHQHSPELPVYWCIVNRRNVQQTFERVAQITVALREKELWANLTGGANVLNFALEMASILTGDIARLYYVLAQDDVAEKCIRYTNEADYWIEMPAMPLNISRVVRAVIRLLENHGGPINVRDLYARLLSDENAWSLVQGVSPDSFQSDYLRPMWKQGLISEQGAGYVLGQRWRVLEPYDRTLAAAREAGKTITDLVKDGMVFEDVLRLDGAR